MAERSKLVLHDTRTEEISFVSRPSANKKLKLKFSFKHELRYVAPGLARAELTVTADPETKEDGSEFGLKIKQVGIFSHPSDMPREVIHTESFGELFPYAGAAAASVSALAGAAPVRLPRPNVSPENVYKIEFKLPQFGNDGTEDPQ